ncbi:MAG: hypothetical protein M1840_004375 [Geoglossum simile]|nr:MAG: hypothetical protein M1840_004375 [Geoglossum simile]
MPLINFQVQHYHHYNSQHTADPNRQKRQPDLCAVKPIYAMEDERKRSEEGKEYAECEGDVEAEEEDDWFGEEHVYRPGERSGKEVVGTGQDGGGVLGRRGALAGAAGVVEEDNLFVGFRGGDGQEIGEGGKEEDGPLGPAPAIASSESANDGAWSRKRCKQMVLDGHYNRGRDLIIYSPNDGPANGASNNKLVATPLSLTAQRSALDPAPTASTGLPKTPANTLKASTPPQLFATPPPTTKTANTGIDIMYTIFLPYVSLSGAAITGPNARPRVYKDRPRRATVVERWNSCWREGMPGV